MLKKSERLSRSRLSERSLARRSFAFGTITFLPGGPGAAVVVSKKISRTAIARNKIRRRVYSVVQRCIREGQLTRSVVIYPNKTALTAPFAALKAALEKALAS